MFCGAPGRHRRLAGAARAPSRAGRESICFAPPRGFLNRSLLLYSLWDLEKPVVPDNPWTRQHRRSRGSPGTRRCPSTSSWGGHLPQQVRWEGSWVPHCTPSHTPGSCSLPRVTCPWSCLTWGVQGGLSLHPAPGLGWLPAPGFALGPFAAVCSVFPWPGEAGARVGCSGVCGAVHPCARRTPACAGCGAASSGRALPLVAPGSWQSLRTAGVAEAMAGACPRVWREPEWGG